MAIIPDIDLKIKKNNKISAPKLILAIVMLFNIPIGIIDLLPNFIGYIILANQFRRAASRAPYFAEAHDALKKLAFITAAKIPAFFLLVATRSADTLGFDSYAVASWGFGVLEIIFLIKAVGNLFEALFRLGQRTDATALITPINVGGSLMTPETLRGLNYIFVVCKTFLGVLPDSFRLTSTVDSGSIRTVSPLYPYVFIFSHLIGLILGVFWMVVLIKYIKSVKKQGQYDKALNTMASADRADKLEITERSNYIRSVLKFFCISTFFTIDIKFDNTDYINLVPHTIYAVLLVILAVKLGNIAGRIHTKRIIVPALLYTVASAFYYVYETDFLYDEKLGYDILLETEIVPPEYTIVQILSVIETLFLTITLVMVASALRSVIINHTCVPPTSLNYSQVDKSRHRTLLILNYVMISVGILSGIAKCIDTYSHSMFKIGFIDLTAAEDITIVNPHIALPKFPWMGLVSVLLAATHIGLSMYLTSRIKDEVEMKYTTEQTEAV